MKHLEKHEPQPRTESGPSGEMTKVENKRLYEILVEVDAGIDSWRRIGGLLAELRDGRLYRGTHRTIAEFCTDRWEFSKSQSDRYVSSFKLADHYEKRMLNWVESGAPGRQKVPKFTGVKPVNPLSKVPDERIGDVSKRLVECADDKGRLTERIVRNVVSEVCGLSGEDKQQVDKVKCPTCRGKGWVPK